MKHLEKSQCSDEEIVFAYTHSGSADTYCHHLCTPAAQLGINISKKKKLA